MANFSQFKFIQKEVRQNKHKSEYFNQWLVIDRLSAKKTGSISLHKLLTILEPSNLKQVNKNTVFTQCESLFDQTEPTDH